MNASSATVEFQAFREELATKGFFKRSSGRCFAELGVFIAATVLGVGLLLATDNVLLQAAAMWLITLASLGVSTQAHTSSHNAVSNKAWVNRAVTYFGYPFFLQLSATFWRHKHLALHHPHPNVVGVDYDADLTPFFALTEDEVAAASAWRRTLYRYQLAYLPVVLVFNAFNVVHAGWAFLISRLLDGNARRREHWIDLGALLLHYTVWLGLPMLYLSPVDVITFNVLRFALISYGMYVIFAPAHFPPEAVMLGPDYHGDIVARQTLTTVNYRTGWLGRLICGGLEYQIEHHLLPSINPAHYPRLSAIVREYCERYGYPYRTLGWGEALRKSLVTFAQPKRVYSAAPRSKNTSPSC